MRSFSDEWLTAMTSAAIQPTFRMDVIDLDGSPLYTTDDTTGPLADVFLGDGTIAVDRKNAVRRTVDCNLVDPDGSLVPTTGSDLLSTTGGYAFKFWAGYVLPVSGRQMYSQGVFRPNEVDPEDSGSDLRLSLRGSDLSAMVTRAGLTKPYIVPNGSNGPAAVQALIQDGVPGLQFSVTPSNITVPRSAFDEQSDRWDKARGLATSFGYEVFLDADGICVIQPVPDGSLREGKEFFYSEGGGLLLTVGRPSNNLKSFNGYILTGESSFGLTPARAEEWDTDPDSPTYYLGTYGKAPDFETRSDISSAAQVRVAAKAGLLERLGAEETVQFTAVPNYAHEEADLVRVSRARLGLDGSFSLMLDAFTIRFGPQPIEFRCRERRIL